MPNNVETTLTVKGGEREIKRLIKFMKGETAFDFNKIVQMPPELKAVTTGACTIDGMKVSVWLEIDGKSIAIPAATLEEWKNKYGATNWYDWASKNWGTKWNAYDVTKWTYGNHRATIAFFTAWGSPEKLIRELAAIFPILIFTADVAGEVENKYSYSFNE